MLYTKSEIDRAISRLLSSKSRDFFGGELAVGDQDWRQIVPRALLTIIHPFVVESLAFDSPDCLLSMLLVVAKFEAGYAAILIGPNRQVHIRVGKAAAPLLTGYLPHLTKLSQHSRHPL